MTNNFNTQNNRDNFQQHPFHLVKPSPWLFFLAFLLCLCLIFTVLWLYDDNTNIYTFCTFLTHPASARVIMCVLAVGALIYGFNPVAQVNKEKWAWVSKFLPARDLKLVGQKGKYTEQFLAQYWGIANFVWLHCFMYSTMAMVYHQQLQLYIATLVFSYLAHTGVFIWNNRIWYSIWYTSDNNQTNALNLYALSFCSPYLLNGTLILGFFISVIPSTLPIDPSMLGEDRARSLGENPYRSSVGGGNQTKEPCLYGYKEASLPKSNPAVAPEVKKVCLCGYIEEEAHVRKVKLKTPMTAAELYELHFGFQVQEATRELKSQFPIIKILPAELLVRMEKQHTEFVNAASKIGLKEDQPEFSRIYWGNKETWQSLGDYLKAHNDIWQHSDSWFRYYLDRGDFNQFILPPDHNHSKTGTLLAGCIQAWETVGNRNGWPCYKNG